MFFFCLVLQEVNPHVIITSAKQEHCMTRFLQQLGELEEKKTRHIREVFINDLVNRMELD